MQTDWNEALDWAAASWSLLVYDDLRISLNHTLVSSETNVFLDFSILGRNILRKSFESFKRAFLVDRKQEAF